MPTVNLDRKEVEKLIGKELPIEELKDRISMLGTDLDDVTDDEIQVEIFPDRPDMLSEQGFARALSSFIGVKTGLINYKAKKSDYKVLIEKSVSKVRPKTVCAVIKNLEFDDEKLKSLIQIQEKLHTSYGRNRKKVAIGVYPLEKIKFPIRYLALEPEKIKFKPLEFDKEINGREILELHPTGKEYGYLLDKEEVFPVFIDANDQVLSMPPIINSHNVGKVSEETKDVFIECSGFDFDVLSKCLNFIVTALADINGDIYEVNINGKKTPVLENERRKLNLDYVNKILGLKLKESEVKDLLEKMGYGYDKEVIIPCYRADILHDIDLVEDIAIAYGYENFEEEIPNVSTIGKEKEINVFKRKISEVLVGLELIECSSFHLSNEENLNKKMKLKNELIEVESAVNTDYNVLRNSLLPNLLKILSENKRYEYPQSLFEIGIVWDKLEEKNKLCIVMSDTNVSFTNVKQVLESLINLLELKVEVKEEDNDSFIAGRCGKILVNDVEVGVIGEMHPQVLVNFGIEMPVSALELDLSKLI